MNFNELQIADEDFKNNLWLKLNEIMMIIKNWRWIAVEDLPKKFVHAIQTNAISAHAE